MRTVEHPAVDRAGWPAGPWDGEPDRLEWEHAGLPCLLTRSEHSGHLCGYVAVLPGHPWHGKHYGATYSEDGDERTPGPDDAISVHGGLTFASKCEGKVCHVPKPGEPDDVWWFGFDCNHSFDEAPGSHHRSIARLFVEGLDDHRAYRGVAYVRAEIESLAEQLAQIGGAR